MRSPIDDVKALGIQDNERMKVYLDKEKHRVIFELVHSGPQATS